MALPQGLGKNKQKLCVSPYLTDPPVTPIFSPYMLPNSWNF